MDRKMPYRIIIPVFLLALVWWGCQVDSPPPPETAQQLVDDGWAQYATANYQGARDLFNQASALDGSVVDAYNGAGWSSAKLNDLSTAMESFGLGQVKDTSNLEIRAGIGIIENARKNYAFSDSSVLSVLSENSSWVFSRDTSINSLDLHLLLAENFFAEAEYELSRDQVHLLDPSFPSALDVTTVAGRTALAMAIENLRAVI